MSGLLYAGAYIIIFIVFNIFIGYNISDEVIFERAGVCEFDPFYVNWANASVVRYGRRSPYYVNLEGEIRHSWGNNITIDIIFYELLSNEYRRSFVEMHMTLCKALSKDGYIGGLLNSGGLRKCPLEPGVFRLMNMSVPTSAFNSVWPFKNTRLDITVVDNVKKHKIGSGFIQLIIKKTKKKA